MGGGGIRRGTTTVSIYDAYHCWFEAFGLAVMKRIIEYESAGLQGGWTEAERRDDDDESIRAILYIIPCRNRRNS